MPDSNLVTFDPAVYLAKTGLGRQIIHTKKKVNLFCQGEAADAVFYILKGRAKVTVVSQNGKEATITLLAPGDFVGEEAISAVAGFRMSTATTVTVCSVLRIERGEMLRVIHEEQSFSELFLAVVLTRSMRTQADLIDQLFNSSEKRLARILLLMADFDKRGEPIAELPKISQQTLAGMIGTTRSRVGFFMNRFRQHGFVNYNGRIQVHKSLLNVVLYDRLPEQTTNKPSLFTGEPQAARERKVTRASTKRPQG